MSYTDEPVDHKLNILMGARHLTVLKAGYNKHQTWLGRLLKKWMYVPLETYRVAYFTEPGSAHDYIMWASQSGPRPNGHRFRTDSVLAGYERAWIEPFWTRVPIDPKMPKSHLHEVRPLQTNSLENS